MTLIKLRLLGCYKGTFYLFSIGLLGVTLSVVLKDGAWETVLLVEVPVEREWRW